MKSNRSSLGNKSIIASKGHSKRGEKHMLPIMTETFPNEAESISGILTQDEMDVISSAYKPTTIEKNKKATAPIDKKRKYTKEEIKLLKQTNPNIEISESMVEGDLRREFDPDDEGCVISPRNEIDIFDEDSPLESNKSIIMSKNDSFIIGSRDSDIRDQTWIYCHEHKDETLHDSGRCYKSTFTPSFDGSEIKTNMTPGRRRLLKIIDENSREEKKVMIKDQKLDNLDETFAAQHFREFLINKSMKVPQALE